MRPDKYRGIIIGLTLAVFLAGYGMLVLTGATTIRHLLDNALSAYLLGWALYGMFSRMPLSETGTRFLLTTGSLLFCWLLAEGAVLTHLVDYRTLFGAYEPGTALSVTGRRFDRELLWRHEAHYQYEAPYQGNLGAALCTPPDRERTVAVRYDHHGFRNARDLETAELVVIGDSYIEGYITPDELDHDEAERTARHDCRQSGTLRIWPAAGISRPAPIWLAAHTQDRRLGVF